MDEQRRRQLESRLQSVLGELGVLCNELGIELDSNSVSQPPAVEPQRGGLLLLAQLGDLYIGFSAHDLQELVRMVSLSKALDPRPELQGFIDIRGQAVPVLDLRCLLGKGVQEADPEQVIVVLSEGDTRIAVVVDEVLDIYETTPDNYQHREELNLRRGFISGVALIEHKLVAVVDPKRLAREVL
ncbi:MAG: hypothetical protein AUK47_19270 [Deltaproteobacteria bacterium CG2_30_63_29]|nr:MAG: hypothetical protein AUK47_19270 [Deltaproteobacteria bacterium CG2_30_63_29]PJB36334.1 MAG: hypothetical protein CO108_23625 [Deltaproteobacteria bacterium CG_4_9_14_3_um_filter_63_12]